jgi:hypothetical protein
LGLLAKRLVVIANAPRDEGTRIISMRKGNRREQEIYQKRLGADWPAEGRRDQLFGYSASRQVVPEKGDDTAV